jgi:hypothetical protein
MSTGNYIKHGGGHHHNSNKPSINVWVKIGLRDAVRFRIPENSVIVELKVMMREELCDLFENVNPSTIVVRNQKNEALSDLVLLKKYTETENPDLRVGSTAAQPFIVDEPICLVVGPFMEDVEAEFVSICGQMKDASPVKLQEFLDMSPTAKIHWYGQVSGTVDHKLLLDLQATLRKAKQAALYGENYETYLTTIVVTCTVLRIEVQAKDERFPTVLFASPSRRPCVAKVA